MVAAGVAGLLALPYAVGAIPASDADVSAESLLTAVRVSASVPHSGESESLGGLALPLTDDFQALTGLLGDRTKLRVWWRGETDWRVDTLRTTGESGLYRDADGLWSWDFEQDTATRTTEPTVRLPRAADVEPAALARRLLSEARPQDAQRLPSRRIAGRDAAGLRVRPAGDASTLDRVDAWIDPGTGLALRVEVHGTGGGRPVLEAAYLSVDLGTPDPARTRFDPADPGAVRGEINTDLAAAVNVFGRVRPPETLAGLPARAETLGSVGTYGTGLTLLVAVPLPGRLSRDLRTQLLATPGATAVPGGVRLAVGPLSLLLTDRVDRRSWLLTGTVTGTTLDRAATELTR